MEPKYYKTNCTYSTASKILSMTDVSREITRRTFLKHVSKNDLDELEHNLGYNKAFKMANDHYVYYFKSKYNNQDCVYFVHSAIEYIFVAL